jgi:hypothetical protein
MRFVDDEFLLLSRGGRVSPGTEKRVAKALVAEQARREVPARKKRRAPRPSESLRAKSAAAVTAAVGRTRHRKYRAER